MKSLQIIALVIGQLTARASAHGIATAMVHWPDGTFYHGYDPSYQYQQPPPVVIAWSIPKDLTNTFISPDGYTSPDIICHLDAHPAGLAAPVNAGDILEFQWNKWPASHKGPILNYLANCNGPCETTDKTKLKFFKIDEAGLLNADAGLWAADTLLANNLSWSVRLPLDIAPGNYILRHEMIALHAAGNANGAQNYPFCYNLVINSNGTNNPEGILATQMYKPNDPGVLFDLFRKYTTYVIPGPPLYTGALTVSQTKPGPIKATSSGILSYVAPTGAVAAAAKATAAPVSSARGSTSTATGTGTTHAAQSPAWPAHTTMATAVIKVRSGEAR